MFEFRMVERVMTRAFVKHSPESEYDELECT